MIGKSQKRQKNAKGTKDAQVNRRDLVTKEEEQEYGYVLRMLGNGRVECYCYDGKTRLCTIRGKMKSKVWINPGDTVLIGLRDYQDDKADIIHKYMPEEVRQLKKMEELPANDPNVIASTSAAADGGGAFEDDEDEEEFEVDFEDI